MRPLFYSRLGAHLCAILSLAVSSFAMAAVGGSDVGGGQGVVCRNQNGELTKPVELLDLWEARVRYHRAIKSSKELVLTQAHEALDRLKYSQALGNGYTVTLHGVTSTGYEGFRELLMSDVLEITNDWGVERLRDVELPLTQDAYEDVRPTGKCKIEQLIRYSDIPTQDVNILINQDLVDQMDETNQAALLVHEAYYKELRRSGEMSSIRIRRAVGLVFSGYTFESLESVLPTTYYRCESDYSPGLRETIVNLYTYPYPDENSHEYAIANQIEKVNGIPGIGFERAHDGGIVVSKPEYVIRGYGGTTEALGLRKVSFDHVVEFGFDSGSLPETNLTAQLVSAPGLSQPLPKQVLRCRLKNQ